MIRMSEILSTKNSNQPLTTMEDMNMVIIENRRSDDPIHHIDKKQKSLISIYDNNPSQQFQPLIGIIGRNKRSEAFTKRLLLSGFPKPILCDINSIEIHTNYVSYEIFYQSSPTIILITENFLTNFEDLFPQNNQQLIIDTREILSRNFTFTLSPIPGAYRAFGNLSNWEIENGTQRIGVAIEQYSPLNLIKFISDFNCFSRGIFFLDQFSYNNQHIKSFRNCLYSIILTIIIFTLCFLFSIIEYNLDIYHSISIYRQASSITASTSITLLAFLYLIRPLLEFISLIRSKKFNQIFIQHWFQSEHYLSWYSLLFALLHLIFIIFAKLDFPSKYSVSAFFFGILTLIFLFTLSSIHLPWISERLLWKEYYFFKSYLGPFCLFVAFIHNYLYWKMQLYMYNFKFFSMILPLFVLIIHLIIYGIIYPIQRIRNR